MSVAWMRGVFANKLWYMPWWLKTRWRPPATWGENGLPITLRFLPFLVDNRTYLYHVHQCEWPCHLFWHSGRDKVASVTRYLYYYLSLDMWKLLQFSSGLVLVVTLFYTVPADALMPKTSDYVQTQWWQINSVSLTFFIYWWYNQ